MSRRKRSILAVIAVGWGMAECGCHPRPEPLRFDPVPMFEAIGIVNDNISKISGTLRASGPVDGRFTLADGRKVGFHLDGVLFYLAPRYVRFDLKRFGDRKFLLGSNIEYYWCYEGEEDVYRCARHGEDDALVPEMPIRPEQIVDALGLTPVPCEFPLDARSRDDQDAGPSPGEEAAELEPAVPARCVQRVVDDFQQLLFLMRGDENRVALEKEYWLDRYWPRLVRRVVFRDADGVVTMESTLDDYRAWSPGGPLLPHTMSAEWPGSGATLRFRVTQWTPVEGIGPESVQFARPRECE